MISVLLPVRNVEAYLEAAIDSILNQTFRDFEVVAVDDGSTDRTAEILARYAAQDSRIRVVRDPPHRIRQLPPTSACSIACMIGWP